MIVVLVFAHVIFVATLLLEVTGAQGDYPNLFFNMSVAAHDVTTGSAHWTQIHLLRVPKASSSAISAITRRAVGCSPPGPCCKYPGDPPGTCPNPHLFNCSRDNKVIGCTGHNPNYEALLNRSVPSITMVRNPISRSISAFFYPGAHHNSNCTEDINVCFLKYTQQTQWSNVLTKMLTGSYAYSDVQTCASVKQCNHSLELAQRNLRLLTFVGISECWELSLNLLHRRLTSLTPQLQEFEMGSGISHTGTRVNRGEDYSSWSSHLRRRYAQQLHDQNRYDLVLYKAVVEAVYEEAVQLGLMELVEVRRYWQEKMLS